MEKKVSCSCINIISGISFVVFLLIFILLKAKLLYKLDYNVYNYFETFKGSSLYVFFKFFTIFSGEIVSIIVFLVTVVFLYKMHKFQEILFLIFFAAFSVFLTLLLKYTLMVERPVNEISGLSGYSFPSGHAVMSIIVAFMIYTLVTNLHFSCRIKKSLIALLAVYIFLSLFSRIFIGAHWLSDIVGGLVLGIFFFSFCYKIYVKKYHKRATVC